MYNVFCCFFVCLFCLILQLTEGVQWFYHRENYNFPKSQGLQHFPGGPTFSGGGVQMLISIEKHITCDFPGPLPPLRNSIVNLSAARQTFDY